jgi:hypothetical protein
MRALGMQNLRPNLNFQSPTAMPQGATGKGSRIGYREAGETVKDPANSFMRTHQVLEQFNPTTLHDPVLHKS